MSPSGVLVVVMRRPWRVQSRVVGLNSYRTSSRLAGSVTRTSFDGQLVISTPFWQEQRRQHSPAGIDELEQFNAGHWIVWHVSRPAETYSELARQWQRSHSEVLMFTVPSSYVWLSCVHERLDLATNDASRQPLFNNYSFTKTSVIVN